MRWELHRSPLLYPALFLAGVVMCAGIGCDPAPIMHARPHVSPNGHASSKPSTAPATPTELPAAPDSTSSAAASTHPAPAPDPTPVVPPEPPEPPPVTVSITIEDPYKMEERVEPTTKETWWAQFWEHQMWNHGDMGPLIGEPAQVVGHPDPRVIVNIKRATGGHATKELQRIARKYHWINVVRCYRLGAYKDSQLRGWTNVTMVVSTAGRVLRPKITKTELDDPAVAKCVKDKLRTLKFARSKQPTTAFVDIRVGPGDEPMPPPKDLIVPGDGMLEIEKMKEGAAAGIPAFEACYRQALAYAPSLWGRMVIRFHVTKRGKTDEAFESGSRFPDARVQQCILHAARKLRFPRPSDGDIRFLVPFRFKNSTSVIPDPETKRRKSK